MPHFIHHPDGLVLIDDGADSITMTADEFTTLEPAYALPENTIGRIYAPGVRHALTDGSSESGGEFPWSDGDGYIATIAAYRNTLAGGS